ncbi:MAG: hypothetical protein H6729_04660 [Deltaproteobacteria bacterium]|nr:hypothetical protein [Deltaproteobacteria bacterium]
MVTQIPATPPSPELLALMRGAASHLGADQPKPLAPVPVAELPPLPTIAAHAQYAAARNSSTTIRLHQVLARSLEDGLKSHMPEVRGLAGEICAVPSAQIDETRWSELLLGLLDAPFDGSSDLDVAVHNLAQAQRAYLDAGITALGQYINLNGVPSRLTTRLIELLANGGGSTTGAVARMSTPDILNELAAIFEVTGHVPSALKDIAGALQIDLLKTNGKFELEGAAHASLLPTPEAVPPEQPREDAEQLDLDRYGLSLLSVRGERAKAKALRAFDGVASSLDAREPNISRITTQLVPKLADVLDVDEDELRQIPWPQMICALLEDPRGRLDETFTARMAKLLAAEGRYTKERIARLLDLTRPPAPSDAITQAKVERSLRDLLTCLSGFERLTEKNRPLPLQQVIDELAAVASFTDEREPIMKTLNALSQYVGQMHPDVLRVLDQYPDVPNATTASLRRAEEEPLAQPKSAQVHTPPPAPPPKTREEIFIEALTAHAPNESAKTRISRFWDAIRVRAPGVQLDPRQPSSFFNRISRTLSASPIEHHAFTLYCSWGANCFEDLMDSGAPNPTQAKPAYPFALEHVSSKLISFADDFLGARPQGRRLSQALRDMMGVYRTLGRTTDAGVLHLSIQALIRPAQAALSSALDAAAQAQGTTQVEKTLQELWYHLSGEQVATAMDALNGIHSFITETEEWASPTPNTWRASTVASLNKARARFRLFPVR